jgi:hypothetical protein
MMSGKNLSGDAKALGKASRSTTGYYTDLPPILYNIRVQKSSG